jgi:O-antigen/teichoic acid export membrane protein
MSEAPSDRKEPDPVGGFLAILSGDVGALLLGLAITPAIVRLLGTEAYGDYAFVISVLSVLVVVANAGIGDGIRKFLPEARDDGWQPRVFSFYLLVAVGLAVVVAGAMAAVATVGADRILGAPALGRYLLLAAGLLVVRQLFLTGRSGLMGLGLEQYSEPLLVVRKALFGVVAVGLAAVGWGVVGVLVGVAVA